jgi:glutamate-1-semialdehyde 2,1-aminomutase
MNRIAETEKRFLETFSKSYATMQKHRDKIPNGFSRKSFMYGPTAIFADHGDGQYIETIDGVKLLDLNNNFTVNILGHHNPAVEAAIRKALETGYSFGNPTEPEYDLASILTERIASVDRVKFFCSASEACMGALRIARAYTGRQKIAKFEGGYHGFGDELAISGHCDPNNFMGPSDRPVSRPDSAGIPDSAVDNVVVMTQNDYASTERILRENADQLACVIMELQSCAGGCVVLDKAFVKMIRRVTKELGIVLIFDETCTLRADRGGLQSLYGVTPDLTVMGKIIGGGIPIGAVGGSEAIMDMMEKKVVLSGTHHGHLMAASAGIATLNELDDAAYAKLNTQAESIKTALNTWAAEKGIPMVIMGELSILGYVFTKEMGQTIHTMRDYWGNTDEEAMELYAMEMAMRGFYPVARGQIALTLPMTDEDITQFIENSKDVIAKIYG